MHELHTTLRQMVLNEEGAVAVEYVLMACVAGTFMFALVNMTSTFANDFATTTDRLSRTVGGHDLSY